MRTLNKRKPYYNKDTKTLFLSTTGWNKLVEKTAPQLVKTGLRINFYITAIKEEDVALIQAYLRALKENKLTDEIEDSIKHLPNLTNVIAYGNGNDGGGYVFSSIFEMRHPNHQSAINAPKWRSYEQTSEYWGDNPYINMCPDSRMCYESALRKLGAEGVNGINNKKIPFYTLIHADTVKNPIKVHSL